MDPEVAGSIPANGTIEFPAKVLIADPDDPREIKTCMALSAGQEDPDCAHTPRCGYPRRSLGFILLQRFVGRPRRRACLTRTAGIAICNAAVEWRSGRLLGASGLGCRRLGAGIAVFSIATGMWQTGGLRRPDRGCGGRVCRCGFILGHFQLSPFQHADGRTTKSGHWTERSAVRAHHDFDAAVLLVAEGFVSSGPALRPARWNDGSISPF